MRQCACVPILLYILLCCQTLAAMGLRTGLNSQHVSLTLPPEAITSPFRGVTLCPGPLAGVGMVVSTSALATPVGPSQKALFVFGVVPAASSAN